MILKIGGMMRAAPKSILLNLKALVFTLVFVGVYKGASAKISETIKNFQFANYSIDNGLSHNFITSIYQDEVGYIWIGGMNGLDRFDGNKFKHFSRNDNDSTSIIGDLVHFIYKDKLEGKFWVGTQKGGLHLFSPEKESFYHIPDTVYSDSHGRYFANCIAEDQEGNLWIGTNNGLKKLNRSTLTFTSYSHNNSSTSLINNVINKLHIDSKGILWIGTAAGVNLLDVKRNVFSHIELPAKIPTDIEIWDFYEESDSVMWIGTYSNGIVKHNRNTNKNEVVLLDEKDCFSNTARVFVEDDEGKVWVGGRNGVFIYDKENNNVTHCYQDDTFEYGIPHNSVLTIFKDKNGDIWLGTRNGISHWSKQKQAFNYYHSNKLDNRCLNSSSVFNFEEFQNLLFIATESGGVNILNSNNTFEYLKPPQLNIINIKCIKQYKGELWIGTYMGGVNVYNPKLKTVSYYKTNINSKQSIPDDRVNVIFKDSINQLWLGTGKGLVRYVDETNLFDRTPLEITTDPINWIAQDKENNLWFATSDHIYSINLLTNELVKNIPTDVVTRHLHIDKQNNYWITTVGKGLALLNKEKETFTYYSTDIGFSSPLTFGVLEDDDDNLWVSTANGLNCFSLKTKHVKKYYKNDGTCINQYNYNSFYKAKNGDFLLGGTNGFVRFNPKNINYRTDKHELVIDQFTLVSDLNKHKYIDIADTGSVRLHHSQNFFTIDYTALEYAYPKRIQYEYKLEGVDANWVKAGNYTQAFYTKVRPGTYYFKVRCIDSINGCKQKSKVLTIVIKPPVYHSLGFKISIILLLVFVVAFAFYYRSKIQRKLRLQLEAMVREKTSSLERNKTEILEQKEEIQVQNEQLVDLSETIKQQNLELESYALDLEQKVVKRTQELESAKKRAEESDRLKSAFLANVSHEIRTPMNGILGFTDLLKDKDISYDEMLMYVETIEKSGERMLNIINDIIDLSKIESNQTEIKIEPVCVKSVFEYLQKFYKVESVKNGVKFVCTVPERNNGIVIKTDQIRLVQILSNIISNAFKFTEKGEVRFSYYYTAEELFFKISDTGIGIDSEMQNQIFKRFTQVDSAISKKYEGAGLGLFICKVLVAKLGGKISLNSELNKGSTFVVTLPLEQ